jgi:hypothetical protein
VDANEVRRAKKSQDIYGSPKEPVLKKEYDDYLKKRLEELRKKYQK